MKSLAIVSFVIGALFLSACGDSKSSAPNVEPAPLMEYQQGECPNYVVTDFSKVLRVCQSAQINATDRQLCLASIDSFLTKYPKVNCSIAKRDQMGDVVGHYQLSEKTVLNTKKQLEYRTQD